jgi:hypothetical protein
MRSAAASATSDLDRAFAAFGAGDCHGERARREAHWRVLAHVLGVTERGCQVFIGRARIAAMPASTLVARLRPPHRKELVEFESEFFESIGSSFRKADGEEIAVHTGGMWHGQGTVYIAIEFAAQVVLRFDQPELEEELTIGPFTGLHIVDGAIWDMREPPKLLARFDDAGQLWHVYEAPVVAMPRLTVRPA